MVVRDVFPLPHIDMALQVAQNHQWLTLFNLAHDGYLQIFMNEADIKKTAF